MSFWERSISDRYSLFRAIILILILFLLTGLVAFTIYKFVFVPRSTDIELNGNAVNIKFGGERVLNVVTVPAYQFTVPTRVTLDKKREIKIRANGLVSTAANEYDLDNELISKMSKVEQKLLKLELQRDVGLGWRRPNGAFVYSNETNANSEKDGSKCIRDASEKLKADKSVDYGYLLAFVKPELSKSDPDEILADKNTLILKIGEGATIKYNEKEDQFIVSGGNLTKQSLPGEAEGGEIFFTINDTIIRKPDDMLLENECLKEIKGQEARRSIAMIRHIQMDIANKFMKSPKTPYAIWYLNNKGFFTVNLLQEPPS